MLTCEQVAELELEMGAGTLSADVADEVLAHVSSCDRHGAIAEYRAVLLAAGLAQPPVAPPARLRSRVLTNAANANGQRSRVGWWLAGSATAASLVMAITLFAVFRGGSDDGDSISRSFETESGITVHVVTRLGTGEATLSFGNLPDLATGDAFNAWAIRDSEWLWMGSFEPGADGAWEGTFRFQLHPGDALCLTAGDSGGRYLPQGEPLFIEPL